MRIRWIAPYVVVTEEIGQIEPKDSDLLRDIISRLTPMQLKIERPLGQADNAVMVVMIVRA